MCPAQQSKSSASVVRSPHSPIRRSAHDTIVPSGFILLLLSYTVSSSDILISLAATIASSFLFVINLYPPLFFPFSSSTSFLFIFTQLCLAYNQLKINPKILKINHYIYQYPLLSPFARHRPPTESSRVKDTTRPKETSSSEQTKPKDEKGEQDKKDKTQSRDSTDGTHKKKS